MRKLSVLVVGDFRPQIGGVARYVEELIDLLSKRGHSVYLFHSSYLGKDVPEKNIFRVPISPKKLGRLAIVGFPRVFIKSLRRIPLLLLRPKRVLHLAVLCARCKEILFRRKIDVIHSMHIDLRSLACIFAVRRKIPIVVSAHGFDTLLPNSASIYSLRKLICQNAHAIMTQTEIKKKHLKGLFERDFIVVPNFVSANRTFFHGVTFYDEHLLLRKKSKAKRKLGFEDRNILILFATRLVKEKGIYELIRAFEKLLSTSDSSARLRLIIAGDGPEKENVTAIVQKNPVLSGNVQLAFNLNYDALTIFHAASDIFAYPTHLSETMPMAIIEAMAHGEAVVTNDFQGVKEIITHKHDGFIMSSRNIDSLFAHLRKLVEDSDLRMRIGWNAYRTFLEKFKSELTSTKIEEIYEEVSANASMASQKLGD